MTSVRYVVLDIETTGLSPNYDAILEVGAIAVGPELEVLGRFRSLVAPWGLRGLSPLAPVVQEMHTKNGLLEELKLFEGYEQIDPKRIDTLLADWLGATLGCAEKSVVLAGHTISFDHSFLKAQFPKTSRYLSHRMFDFGGAFISFMRSVGYDMCPTPMPHRAMEDAAIELEELRVLDRVLREDARDARRYRALGLAE